MSLLFITFIRWSLIVIILELICISYLNVNNPFGSSAHHGVVFLNYNTDKDQDGTFRWVDKTAIEFSNWSPDFPQNSANLWDCGQIYTGKILDWVTQCRERHSVSLKRLSSNFFSLITGNYAGKWETTNCFKNLGYICKMSGGQNVKPTTAPGKTTKSPTLSFNPNERLLMLIFRLTQTLKRCQFYREVF